MLEVFLNRLTRNLPEKHKETYKRDFYNNLTLARNSKKNTIFFRILYSVIFIILMVASIVAVLTGYKIWWFPLLLFLILLIIHFIETIKWTTFQTSYMWKNEVLIPKRYNKIALLFTFILFALIIYFFFSYTQNH